MTLEEIPPIFALVLALTTNTPMLYINQTPEPTIEEIIEERLGPEMIDVAYCESGLMHIKNGEVVVSPTNDIGLFQINVAAHGERAEELGIDIYSLEGNLAYAERLYEKSGTRDWYASEHCWSKL